MVTKRFAPFAFTVCLSAIALLFQTPSAFSEARIWEEELTIPTYEVGAPDLVPRFYDGRVYQGAQGRIYPYPISDKLTDAKVDKAYNAVYLENEYVKICVLPEIGGRIFTALDKTNNYDYFYRQRVIKPALIGMLGAWISGGVEWNALHHHRTRTFMEMDRLLVENPDGSKTVWLGELDRRHRMRFVIGLTLYPGKSYLEATVKIFNRTPFVNSLLYFANPAVSVNDTYQVIFPPDNEYVTQHAKREFTEWPIANSRYGGMDYKNTDISWWKNLPASVSFFCWSETSDFFAGYDHGKKAGVAYVGDHNVAPGKKFFTFGCGEAGTMWDKMLTDSDGPYLELMAGGYSDNQPDYSWTQPFETKIVKQYWFPIRELEGMKFANLEGALNLTVADNKTVKIRLNTTSERKNAILYLKEGEKILLEKSIDISPAQPYQTEITTDGIIVEENLTLLLYSTEGKKLFEYRPAKRPGEPKPKPVVPPAKPEDIKTNEELYLAGLRLDQFHNAQVESYPYYEEALRRDPGDSRVNTQLGILYLKRGMFAEAEIKLETAVARLTANYTRPRDGEAYYYLGLAQRAQGKREAAYDSFNRAAWSSAWHTPSYYALAELDCLKGDYAKALEGIDNAIATNNREPKLLNLKSAILRKLNREEEAEKLTAEVAKLDPLDYGSKCERMWINNARNPRGNAQEEMDVLVGTMKDEVQTLIELAVDYGTSGFYGEAIVLLTNASKAKPKPGESAAMAYYYMAYYWDKIGDVEQSQKCAVLAMNANADYCFPFRLESIEVLQWAIDQFPQDNMAPYYLGNLLYDWQPEKAIQLWQIAAERGCEYYINYRNLGYACGKEDKDIPKAVAYYEKALQLNPNDARVYYELDSLYEQKGETAKTRLAVMEKNQTAVEQRDDTLERELSLFVQSGQYDKAINQLTTRHFHTWEGGGNIHGVYVDAYLLRGMERMNGKNYGAALTDFEASLLYPDNLEVAKDIHDENAARAFYLIGSVYELQGDETKAKDYYQRSAAVSTRRSEVEFFKALAHQKLGESEAAAKIFDRLISRGERMLSNTEESDFFAKFGERQTPQIRQAIAHYLIGLGNIGKGDAAKAKSELEKAIELNPDYAWAKVQLAKLQ